ncbi:MAG: hypothetical protein H0X40_03480 [Chthoniobacterales bacterium]|nr:hypothetical protein [Chthoniobacterales bacterium]
MNTRYSIGNGILWAAAIVAAALFHAPAALTSVVLPALAVGSLVLGEERATDCRMIR